MVVTFEVNGLLEEGEIVGGCHTTCTWTETRHACIALAVGHVFIGSSQALRGPLKNRIWDLLM